MITIKEANNIIENYKDVEFHKKDGSIYHAKNMKEFKMLLNASIALDKRKAESK